MGFGAAGLEVMDGGFVDLSVRCAPMFVLDFTIDDREPVGGKQRPVAEGLAMETDSHPGEYFRLPVVGEVADEAVIYHLGDEAGGGDAAVLEGGRERVDEGLGGGVVLADEFAAHELDADEFGGLVVELLADFLTDASEVVRVEQDFGRVEFFAEEAEGVRGCKLYNYFFVK